MKPSTKDQLLVEQTAFALGGIIPRERGSKMLEQLSAFLKGMQERSDAHSRELYAAHGPEFFEQHRKFYAVSDGAKRYARVYTRNASGNDVSAFCFVDLTDGNIYKPAGWKSPEKNFPRGNVLLPADDKAGPFSWFGVYGIKNAGCR